MQPPLPKSKKRTVSQSTKPNKKTKHSQGGASTRKERAFQRETIPIPDVEGDSDLSNEDVEFFTENKVAGHFLQTIDPSAIGRSKHETERLFELSKAPYRVGQKSYSIPQDLSEASSNDWSSGVDDLDSNIGNESGDDDESSHSGGRCEPMLNDSEDEQPYELKPRKPDANQQKGEKLIKRLPIKLSNGKIQQIGAREANTQSDEDSDEESDPPPVLETPKRNITGARFGRASIADILSIESKSTRIQVAQEQLAGICQEILTEPESNLGLLRRLVAFASETIERANGSGFDRVPNDTTIRQLAIISSAAVFKDIAPGYRIRKLSEKELAEKVSQMVGQTRDWEQGLVATYQSYLQLLDKEITGKTQLKDTCLRCMCTLLTQLTHFNFRTNILSTLIANISRKTWDDSSERCLNALVMVFKDDQTGVPSLEAVRLLNRMIKERHYSVNPRVLSCLLHLRLKNELKNVRASKEHADKKLSGTKAKAKRAKGKGKAVDAPHLSKKAKKALKETKQIRVEMEEAEAVVDEEDRATQQTETLKLLFVLYFSILKGAHTSPLLSVALQGIARFAHLINIDFFRDLLSVIREIMSRASETKEGSQEYNLTLESVANTRLQVLCTVTAFELLTGQGEALDLDLSHFTSYLYRLLPLMAVELSLDVDNQLKEVFPDNSGLSNLDDLLFRALASILMPKYGKPSSNVLAAFSKRLLSLAVHTPPKTTVRILGFVQNLLGQDSKLDALLSTEERVYNGVYRDDVDDPQLCNPFAAVWWEVLALEESHYDDQVRNAAHQLRTWRPS
ncbi:hypothetical protein FS842_003385 [Serendipita sp. 407]|nr:hypothetical protein FS842_003385 [Serendipita sp. 407]